MKGGPFGLARYGMLRGKTGKPFLVQFARPNGAIIFCRTFKNYFGQFVWIEKSHYNSRVSLHEAPTKKSQRVVYTTWTWWIPTPILIGWEIIANFELQGQHDLDLENCKLYENKSQQNIELY